MSAREASSSPAEPEATEPGSPSSSLVGTQLPADLLQTDPGILTDVVFPGELWNDDAIDP